MTSILAKMAAMETTALWDAGAEAVLFRLLTKYKPAGTVCRASPHPPPHMLPALCLMAAWRACGVGLCVCRHVPSSVALSVCLSVCVCPGGGAGMHRHVRMVQLQQALQADTGRAYSLRAIWAHLSTLYDLAAIEAMVRRPPACALLHRSCATEYVRGRADGRRRRPATSGARVRPTRRVCAAACSGGGGTGSGRARWGGARRPRARGGRQQGTCYPGTHRCLPRPKRRRGHIARCARRRWYVRACVRVRAHGHDWGTDMVLRLGSRLKRSAKRKARHARHEYAHGGRRCRGTHPDRAPVRPR
jgi:hypothetical protein